MEVVFCVSNVVCECVRDDSASKASGCCVVFCVWTLKKKCEWGRYVLPLTAHMGRIFLPQKCFQWARIKKASQEPPSWIAVDMSNMSGSGWGCHFNVLLLSKCKSKNNRGNCPQVMHASINFRLLLGYMTSYTELLGSCSDSTLLLTAFFCRDNTAVVGNLNMWLD